MALTAASVRVGVTGAVYAAPTGTALPTTPSASLNGAFEDLGYVSDAGITESTSSESATIKAWQNGDEVRVTQTSHSLTFALGLMETSDETMNTYYGSYTAGVTHITGDQLDHQSWVIDIVDGDAKIRIVIPDGQVTERGDVTYANEDAIIYPITISCFPDVSSVKAYKYFALAGS